MAPVLVESELTRTFLNEIKLLWQFPCVPNNLNRKNLAGINARPDKRSIFMWAFALRNREATNIFVPLGGVPPYIGDTSYNVSERA